MNIRAHGSVPPDTGVAHVGLPTMRRHDSTRLALVASLLLALLLTACDSSPAPVLKTPIATANLASENLYIACSGGVIHVLRARDGAVAPPLYELAGPLASAPTLSAGVLYNGERNSIGDPGDTALVARDIATRRELWRTVTPGNVVAPPVIQQDTVYAVANNNAVSTLLALDARSGAIRWRYESREGIVGSPTVNGETVWAATSPSFGAGGSLLALRAQDGTLLWRVPLAEGSRSSPVLAQGILYAGSFLGALYALRADTGATVWVYHTTLSSAINLSVLDGVVYASADDGTLFALNSADGRRLWTRSSIARHLGWGDILAQDQTIYAGAPDGLLYAVDARTGATLRAYQLDDQPPITGADTSLIIWSAPILRDGVLYIERTAGDQRYPVSQVPSQVIAIDRDTGAVRWTQTILDAPCSPLVIG